MGPAEDAGKCVHQLGQWLIKATKSSLHFPDGVERPAGIRGGRLFRVEWPCVHRPGHTGGHQNVYGTVWP